MGRREPGGTGRERGSGRGAVPAASRDEIRSRNAGFVSGDTGTTGSRRSPARRFLAPDTVWIQAPRAQVRVGGWGLGPAGRGCTFVPIGRSRLGGDTLREAQSLRLPEDARPGPRSDVDDGGSSPGLLDRSGRVTGASVTRGGASTEGREMPPPREGEYPAATQGLIGVGPRNERSIQKRSPGRGEACAL